MIAQQMGFSLARISEALADLPIYQAPNKQDWQKVSRSFRKELDEKIETLTRLRDRLDGCIGCGCLSLDACALYNPQDEAAEEGPGPRRISTPSN